MSQHAKHERFLELLKPYHDRLARFARAMTHSREEAEDLVGDTILQAYEHFEQLRDEQAFLGWLFAIASRLQKRRRWKARLFDRLSTRFGSYDDDSDTGAEAEPPSHGELAPDTFVDVQLLYEALERLPHKQREAFVMFEVTGLSLAEIQEIQGDSLSAVKMRLVRAREALRTMLESTSIHDTTNDSETAQQPKQPRHATIHHLPTPVPKQSKQ